MERAFVLVVLAAAVGLVPIACSGTSAPAPGPDAGLSADTGSVPEASEGPIDAGDDVQDALALCPAMPSRFGSRSCDRCMAATCCGVITSCAANAACDVLLRCVLTCLRTETDAGGCRAGCIANNPDGEEGFFAVDACWAALPPDGCALDCS